MTVVSSKEFVANEEKYFELALNEQVFIKKGENMFLVSIANVGNVNEYDEILEPDDDFRRAISGDELLERIYKDIDRKFVNRFQ
jgi:hypothetical protein